MAIIPFSTSARVGLNYTEVTGQTLANDFEPFIGNTGDFANSGYNPSRPNTSGTNWDAAFATVPDAPDLVVFVTDGDPNGTRATTSFSTTLNGGVDVMSAAVASAGEVKERGSRVFAVGVGPVVNSVAGTSRLTAVSGPNEYPEANFPTSDFTIADEFDELEESLTNIVQAICGGRLTITKRVFGPNGASQRQGWRFSATLSGEPPHRWTVPEDVEPATRPTARRRTDSEGVAEFAWQFRRDATATLSVRERSRRGFRRVLSICRVRNADGEVVRGQTQVRIRGPIARGLSVPIGGWATCRVWNRQRVAHLRVVKRLIPRDDPGRFDLLVNGTPRREAVGHGGRTNRLTLPLGRYTVSERLNVEASPEGTTLADYEISTRCINRTTGNQVGRGGAATSPDESDPVTVRLRRETDYIVCVITNERPGPPPPEDTPPPPGGDTPPPPCLDVEDDIPVCGDIAAAPDLVVTKRIPARARVGDRVPVTITVQNVGRSTARAVRLHETPARGNRIARVAQGGSIRGDGTAVWGLGNLAPGATRTVRATVLVTRTGLHVDTAVAEARNADPDFDVGAVRARAARRPPPVTG